MPVLRNIGVLARCLDTGDQDDIHEIPNAAVGWTGSTIDWVGPESALPDGFEDHESLDAGGAVVVPGLVDCHTHLAFGGWRSDEFVQRIRGKTYLEIAAAGGGIQRTVRQTNGLSTTELAERSKLFLDQMLALGVTTVEAKSGYGLSLESELRQLETYEIVDEEHPVRLVSTFLAHTIPPEFQEKRSRYIRTITDELLPVVTERGLASFCDVFIEETAFSSEEGRRILKRAKDLGLGLKIHADQLSDQGSAALAAELGAMSADHLERVSDEGIEAMAAARTVAVSLPLASLYLQVNVLPARKLIESGVPVAVATDFNPGSAPSFHLPLALSLACITQRMTPAEALKGATIIAARAIGLENEIGSIEKGKSADMAVIDAADVASWLYHIRPSAAKTVICRGHAHAV